jgi:(R,R)-butanediol dehydrogenase / meso-butanediol dehydrogenase / diacetyl reductase
MLDTMNASVLLAPEHLACQTRSVPVPSGCQVLIKVKRVGICGTDLTIFAGRHPRARMPLVMGHEVVGVVEGSGPRCSGSLVPGDVVTVNPLLWCGTCRSCVAGNSHVCETLRLLGIDEDGGFAEYLVAEELRVHRLDASVTWDEAVLCEPIAVAIHAIRSSRFRMGDDVIVVGAGIIGAILGRLLLDAGARSVTVTDVNPWRLEQASTLGMTALHAGDVDEKVRRGDVVFECSGHPTAFEGLTRLVATSGQIVFVGIPSVPVPLALRDAVFRELSTTAVRVYRNEEFALAADVVSRRRGQLSQFVSTVVPLNQLAEGIVIAREGRGWKVVVDPEA